MKLILAVACVLTLAGSLFAQDPSSSITPKDVGAGGGWMAIAFAVFKGIAWIKARLEEKKNGGASPANPPVNTPSPAPSNPAPSPSDQNMAELLLLIKALIEAIRGGPVQLLGPSLAGVDLAKTRPVFDGNGVIVDLVPRDSR
jgi:hypothetical protein